MNTIIKTINRAILTILVVMMLCASIPATDCRAASNTVSSKISSETFNFTGMPSGVKTVFRKRKIIQTGNVKGYSFKLTIDLSKWEQYTTPRQIVMISKLFWQVYPQMYSRFGTRNGSPRNVIVAVENEGYEIAEMYGNFVHIHDTWLFYNPTDYDCLTHEFAHLLQKNWNGKRLENDSYIERFADYCRYIYAYNNGKYNDVVWALQAVSDEPTRESSVRFLVWLDYNYSTQEKDLLVSYFDVCDSGKYRRKNWKAVWKEIFKGSKLEGQSINTVWKRYRKSGFARLSSVSEDGTKSELLQKYNIRNRIKKKNN
jgi:hypothetical protein